MVDWMSSYDRTTFEKVPIRSFCPGGVNSTRRVFAPAKELDDERAPRRRYEETQTRSDILHENVNKKVLLKTDRLVLEILHRVHT